MTALARSLYRARKQATEWWGLIVVVAFAYLMAMGQFSAKRMWAGDLLVLTGLAIYAATLSRAIMRELGTVTGETASRRRAADPRGRPRARARAASGHRAPTS